MKYRDCGSWAVANGIIPPPNPNPPRLTSDDDSERSPLQAPMPRVHRLQLHEADPDTSNT